MQRLQEAVYRDATESNRNLCLRNHRSYRSCFEPTRGTLDADVCLQFLSSSKADKERVAELMRSPGGTTAGGILSAAGAVAAAGGGAGGGGVKEIADRLRRITGGIL